MANFLRWCRLSFVVALVIIASIIPLPVASNPAVTVFRSLCIGLILIAAIAPKLLRRYAPLALSQNAAPLTQASVASLFILSTLLIFTQGPEPSLTLSSLLLIFAMLTLILFRAFEDVVSGAGALSLLLFLGCLFASESLLRAIPVRYLATDIAVTPPLLAWRDKGEKVFTANGFRGRRPCTDCTERPLRIFTMGGSSTYGIPMYYTTTTYAAVLERLLHERRPFDKIEVFNAGIPGFGVFQILDALKRTVLKYKPDIVTVNAWFNDNGYAPGWYEGLGRNDLDGYQRLQFLRWIQDWPPYRVIHHTRLYAWLRIVLIRAKEKILPVGNQSTTKSKIRRTTPAEFGEGLRRIIKLGHLNDFLPVFVMEPVNRTRDLERSVKRNPYQRVMLEVARAEGVPLVDTLSKLNGYSGQWLFYDLVHTNEAAHSIIADSIYEALFQGKSQTDWGRAFFASRGLALDTPKVLRSPRYQFERAEVESRTMCVTLRAPYATGQENSSEVLLSGKPITTLTATGKELKSFQFRIPTESTLLPIVDFSIRASARPYSSGKPHPVPTNVANGVKDRSPHHHTERGDMTMLAAEMLEVHYFGPCPENPATTSN